MEKFAYVVCDDCDFQTGEFPIDAHIEGRKRQTIRQVEDQSVEILHSMDFSRFSAMSPIKQQICTIMVSAIWVIASLYPSMRLWSKPETVVEQAMNWRDVVGFGLWTLAFIVEAVADRQKQSFYSNPENKVRRALWIE